MKYLCPPTCTGSWCNTKILVLHFCDFSVRNDIHTCILEYQLYMYSIHVYGTFYTKMGPVDIIL